MSDNDPVRPYDHLITHEIQPNEPGYIPHKPFTPEFIKINDEEDEAWRKTQHKLKGKGKAKAASPGSSTSSTAAAAAATKSSTSATGSGAVSPKKNKGKSKARAASLGPCTSSSTTAAASTAKVSKSLISKLATAARRATIKRSQVKKGKYWAFKAEQRLLGTAGLGSDDGADDNGDKPGNSNNKFYVLACPAEELLGVCQADTPNFSRHPFKKNRAVEHSRECGVEAQGEEDIFVQYAMEGSLISPGLIPFVRLYVAWMLTLLLFQ